MAAAGTLDEVIEVHEAYLLSIQRQCFVVPDKLVLSLSFALSVLAITYRTNMEVCEHLIIVLIYSQWGLIASRINSILVLALDFYSVQQTISSIGAVSAIKARCEKEVERIEKQFDDCMAFLLRVFLSHEHFFFNSNISFTFWLPSRMSRSLIISIVND